MLPSTTAQTATTGNSSNIHCQSKHLLTSSLFPLLTHSLTNWPYEPTDGRQLQRWPIGPTNPTTGHRPSSCAMCMMTTFSTAMRLKGRPSLHHSNTTCSLARTVSIPNGLVDELLKVVGSFSLLRALAHALATRLRVSKSATPKYLS